ncbi:hypothetical protein [Cupriavidus necator]
MSDTHMREVSDENDSSKTDSRVGDARRNCRSRPLCRAIAILLTVAAIGLAVFVVWQIDVAPRTDDAYAYAVLSDDVPADGDRLCFRSRAAQAPSWHR